MAPRDTSKPDTSDTPDTSEPPASTSTPAADPQRIVIEQAPAEPAVFYGEDGFPPPVVAAPVKADYKPFEW